MCSNNEKSLSQCKTYRFEKMFQNKQNLNKCKNSLTKLINHLKEMNKTLNNNNLINESIDQNYDHFEQVIDCGHEDNYDMFTKDIIIKDKHLIVKQPIIQFTVNNKLFINNNNNENKTQNKVIKNNKRLKANKNK